MQAKLLRILLLLNWWFRALSEKELGKETTSTVPINFKHLLCPSILNYDRRECTVLNPTHFRIPGKQQLQFGWPSFTTAVVFYLCLNTHKVVTR